MLVIGKFHWGVFTWENSHRRDFQTYMMAGNASVFSSSHIQRVEADEAILD